MDGGHPNAEYSQDAARLAVADILSSMANTVEAMTPTTLAILDGLTGVPTRTTPTLTPTTLRNIEQTFMDLAAVASNQVPHQHEAGFVPPLVPLTIVPHSTAPSYSVTATTQQADNNKLWENTMGNSSSSDSATSQGSMGMFRSTVRRLSEGSDSNSSNSGNSSMNFGPVRKGGGRRKEDRLKDLQLPIEEVEKRRIRRERNKMAAARCRKRRLDQTVALEEETSVLEDKKQSLCNEIRQLTKEKEELEFLLDAHVTQCKLRKMQDTIKVSNPVNIKQEPASPRNEFTKPAPRPRPTSLPVASPFMPQMHKSTDRAMEIAGVPITTPSNGISGLNLESLMEGGTGLTPVVSSPSPSCATQQRSSALPVDLSSPESATRKLVSL